MYFRLFFYQAMNLDIFILSYKSSHACGLQGKRSEQISAERGVSEQSTQGLNFFIRDYVVKYDC